MFGNLSKQLRFCATALLGLELRRDAGLVSRSGPIGSFKLPITVSTMSYAVWQSLYTWGIGVGLLAVPVFTWLIVSAVLRWDRRRPGREHQKGRRLVLGVLLASLVIMVAGGLLGGLAAALQQQYPEHYERWTADGPNETNRQEASAPVEELIVGRWRRRGSNDGSYIDIDTNSYSFVALDYDRTLTEITSSFNVIERSGKCVRVETTRTILRRAGRQIDDRPASNTMTFCINGETLQVSDPSWRDPSPVIYVKVRS